MHDDFPGPTQIILAVIALLLIPVVIAFWIIGWVVIYWLLQVNFWWGWLATILWLFLAKVACS